MICLCLYSNNRDVPDGIRNNNSFITTEFDLKVGERYRIFGQSIFKGKLSYLVDPRDDSTPSWYPAELFTILDNNIPEGWVFQFFPEDSCNGLGAVWGYRELVNDPDHYEGLFERTPEVLRIFARRKLESKYEDKASE